MAKSTIYLLQYNQYYNKIVKRLDTLEDYLPFVIYNGDDYKLTNNAFNPRDHIDAQLIVNTPDASYDYLLVVDEEGNIDSRWFVTEAIYLKAEGVRSSGQYQLNIHRDLLADYLDEVVQSPIYFERAIFNSDNPLIYNSENMLFNQIKTKEILLRDASKSPWVIAYLAKNNENDIPMEEKIVSAYAPDFLTNFEYERDNLPVGTFFRGNGYNFYTTINLKSYPTRGGIWYTATVNSKGEQTMEGNNYNDPTASRIGNFYDANDLSSRLSTIAASLKDAPFDAAGCFYASLVDTNQDSLINTLIDMEGKVIKDANSDTYFRFTGQQEYITHKVFIPKNSNYSNEMANIVANLPYIMEVNNNGFFVNGTVRTYTITSVETVIGAPYQMTIPAASTRLQTIDAPWDILAIPLNEVVFDVTAGLRLFQKEDIAIQLAQSLINQYGKANVYDIQLLPYCPVMQYFDFDSGRFNCESLTEGVHYSLIRYSETPNDPIGLGFWCNESSFSSKIIFDEPIINPTDPIEFKINNECDMYRLVSPNYSSVFEFSATKNGGILGFEVNCTYKPYQPMIHVNPIFNGLYGTDFNDNRGLICGGNYSLPSTTNAWTEYQIQNKSYKESFERQIQNMETTYDINREQMKTAGIINSITAGVQGFASGATAGGIMSGGNLAVAGVTGAVTGLTAGIGSAAGLAADLKYSDQLQKEALSYATDMFNLSLQNIKALPNTLSNIGAFDINYKYFPFLEYYTATPQEKEALRKKLIYNGMAAGVISTISEMRQSEPTYMQGQLIRLNIAEDYHVAASIASEIHRGIYI